MSRFNSIGTAGRKETSTNVVDSCIKTVEFPITVVASATEQDTGIATPTASMQVLGSYLVIDTAETTGLTKTVDIGITSAGAVIQNATSVASAGAAGSPVTAAISTSGSTNFTYTLGSADFVELEATCVVTYIGVDA